MVTVTSPAKPVHAGSHAVAISNAVALNKVPTNGALTQTAAGALGARTEFVRCTWSTPYGEFAASAETSLAVSANNVLNVAAPTGAPSIATGWCVYTATTTGQTKKQATVALATPWVQPTSGDTTTGPLATAAPTFRYPAFRAESRADFNKALAAITGTTVTVSHMDPYSVANAINAAVAAMP